MVPQYRIFYSWQSDDEESSKIIGNALNQVIEQLKKSGISVYIEQGGRGCGFISIEDTIRIKIRRSDIFIGDVTPVGHVKKKAKLLPNANVLYEMGLATECLSPKRILAVAMKNDKWKVENMPFDFNHNTMLIFNDKNGEKKLYDEILYMIRETDVISKHKNSKFFSKRLVDKNIKSRKYLPDTFLEIQRTKDIARCFLSPKKNYPFLYEKLKTLNFDYYNEQKKLKGENKTFKLEIDKWDIKERAIDIEFLQNTIKGVFKYVGKIIETLRSESNTGWAASFKLESIRDDLNVMSKQLMVVTSNAGQGKTNFVCDLVENVLKPNNIPYVFVNAYELSAELLAKSIAAEYDFISNDSLNDVLLKAEKYCNQRLQHLIIVIDGLNEHPKQGLFKSNLTRVLQALCEFKHVKVLMTCRKTYYDNNYQVLQEELKEKITKIELKKPYLDKHIETNHNQCILERYGNYFKTIIPKSESVRNVLLNNMLLLRIFFEVYQDQDVTAMAQIDYIELYQKYYELLCEKIQQILAHDALVNNVGGMSERIFHKIIAWMIENNSFRNLPLENILAILTEEERHCFPAFMSANFILQQDTPEETSGISDVLNFTFEEIRDYLVTRYLVDNIFPKEKLEFEKIISHFTEENNNLAEGSKRFLFLYARKSRNKALIELLKKQKWYEDTFMEYIWDLSDDETTAHDVTKVTEHLQLNPDDYVKTLAYFHWSPQNYKKINLKILLNILNNLEESKRKLYLEKVWPSKTNSIPSYRHTNVSERGQFLSILRAAIAQRTEKEYKIEYDVLKQLDNFLSEGMDRLYVPIIKNDKKKSNYTMFEYDYRRYLLKVHKGTKDSFLSKAGVKAGFAREMFSKLYDAIFSESDDIKTLYEETYFNEYKDLKHFLEMRYNLPNKNVQDYVDACNSDTYRLIRFDANSYGGIGIQDFLMDNVLKERIYKWLNWEDYEN